MVTNDYGYKGFQSSCDYDQRLLSPVRPTGFVRLDSNADSFKKALSEGPIAAVVEADKLAFRFYNSGILNSDKCGFDADHAVSIVGWGIAEGGDTLEYYIVKNSWSSLWGEDGYVRIAIAVGPNGTGICGVHTAGYVPTF